MSKEWIKALKAGDSVIECGRWEEKLTIVDKMTPTGRIKIGATYYDQNGYSLGNGRWDYGTSLAEATPESVERLRQKNVIKQAITAVQNVRSLTYEQAEKILEALKQETHDGD
jgi:hypothetical protein